MYTVRKYRGRREDGIFSQTDFDEEFETLEEAMEYYNSIDFSYRCCQKEIEYFDGRKEIEERIGDIIECRYAWEDGDWESGSDGGSDSGSDGGSDVVEPPINHRPCKCGSTTHRRITHASCPLNKNNVQD